MYLYLIKDQIRVKLKVKISNLLMVSFKKISFHRFSILFKKIEKFLIFVFIFIFSFCFEINLFIVIVLINK